MRYILLATLLAVSGCATTQIEYPLIPIPDDPAWTRLTAPTPCIEFTESGRCVAWKLSRQALDELVRRDEEKTQFILGLKRIMEAHNEAAK